MNGHPGSRCRRVFGLAGLAVLACILAFTSPAGAQTAARKFGRGLADMTTGVLELPGNTVVEAKKHGAAGGPIGVAKGLGMIVSRELVGGYEGVSAPLPVPPGFRPPVQPAFPCSYFQQAPRSARRAMAGTCPPRFRPKPRTLRMSA